MTKIDYKWSSLLESLKEPARYIILTIITWLIYVIVPQLDQRYAAVILIVLRFADKWVHEYKSETGTEGAFKGLLGF